MRIISANGLAKLAQKTGTEPILLLEIDWITGKQPKWYGDRTVNVDIPGKILELGSLDNVVGVSSNTTSQSISVTLDDTDGSIKTIFDRNDIHMRTARVYQWFEGLALTDKFLLFSGKLSTPITWSEKDRTVKFTILSQVEDKEIGFSPEEGQFSWLPSNMVGKAWPMIFGRVIDCPALQINEAVTGTTLDGVGCLAGIDKARNYISSTADASWVTSVALLMLQGSSYLCASSAFGVLSGEKEAEDFLEKANDCSRQASAISSQAARTARCAADTQRAQIAKANSRGLGANPLRILGGEDFPQGSTLTIDVNGCYLTGYFAGQNFHITSRQWPDGETAADDIIDDNTSPACNSEPPPEPIEYDYRIQVGSRECGTRGTMSRVGGRSTDHSQTAIMQQFWADSGTSVKIYSEEKLTYIVSITPGTVQAVKAYKAFTGERRLVNVPASYYTVKQVSYGTVSTVQIEMHRPLSSYADQGWTDDLYVTFSSTIGPNMMDVLRYIIANYTDLTYDSVSFAATNVYTTKFPVNFPILDRKNTVMVLQEIARQARCALWLSNGKFYIKYLPIEPTPVDTITDSDIDSENGIEVDLTPTEDVITKMKIKWRISWAPGKTDRDKDASEKTIILRHNVGRYGTKTEEWDFYIYNQPDSVYKSATFWLIRQSATWKKVKFSTYLNKLNLEAFDCVTLTLNNPWAATGSVKAIVESAAYNSDTNRVDFVCTLPVKAGQMTTYNWYWPASKPTWMTWPPRDEILAGDAGGDGIGQYAGGTLPGGVYTGWDSGGTIVVGGPNVVFRAQSDRGDRTPTDVGYSAQSVGEGAYYAEANTSVKPKLNLVTLAQKPIPLTIPTMDKELILDLSKTRIIDTGTRGRENQSTTLSSFFRGINSNDELVVNREYALVGDDENEEGQPLSDVFKNSETYLCIRADVGIWSQEHSDGSKQFDFKFDDDGDKFGAGTAFLKE